ncbi:MAG TPA: hypothetical protein VNG33_23455, partial [Polyangiaceae bacterium]|nr:hypothetical protein [Polyangiaceae bacterium]
MPRWGRCPWIAAGLSLIACARVIAVRSGPPTRPVLPASQAAVSQQYRLVPLTNQTRGAVDFGDDALRLEHGARVVDQPGKLALVADTVAASPLEGGRRLPDFVGGGFVFWSSDALYRADTFSGALRPLAAASRIERVAVGPGYLIVFADGQRLILDPKTGAAKNPRLVDIVDVAAAADGRVVTALEFGRLAVSVDNNATLREVQSELGGS